MIPAVLQKIIESYGEADRRMVVSAWETAATLLQGRERSNRRPFIEHPLGVVRIVAEEIGLQADAVTAVLLHEAGRFQGEDAAALENSEAMAAFRRNYPTEVVNIVSGLNHISFITLQETNLNEERYRKLILSYSTDPRVVLIKLADRLEIMRNLESFPPSKRKAKMTETILLYVPLAHQLGLYRIKSEMEDLFLRFAEPEQYRLITNHLKATEKDREALAERFIDPLKEKLDRAGIRYTMKARTKSAYSIWKKMQAQKVPFEKIYDVFAMRFIIDCPPEKKLEHELCWRVYSLVTEEYTPDTTRLRDWLSQPKSNGYESLHTTVDTGGGTYVEVQIRTTRMDFEAEQGGASHWSYKGVQSEAMLDGWLGRVRTMMSEGGGHYAGLSPELLGEVYVFTPKGDLRQLPQGATLLDFAFEIHSGVGVRCTGGRINGRMVPLRERLKTGDVVEILTGKNQKPNRDWLDFVVTAKARNKIRLCLKEEENKQAAAGKELLERRLKNWKLEIPDSVMATLVKRYGYKTLGELFAAIGSGDIDIIEFRDRATAEMAAAEVHEEETGKPRRTLREEAGDYLVIGDDTMGKVGYRMARCCNPIYGDAVFGFVTVKEGLKIHRMSCPNAARLLEAYPYRIQKVRWRQSAERTSSQTSLRILYAGEESASCDIISTISLFKASIRSFVTTDRPDGSHEIHTQIYVTSNEELEKIIANLKKNKAVRQVTRL